MDCSPLMVLQQGAVVIDAKIRIELAARALIVLSMVAGAGQVPGKPGAGVSASGRARGRMNRRAIRMMQERADRDVHPVDAPMPTAARPSRDSR